MKDRSSEASLSIPITNTNAIVDDECEIEIAILVEVSYLRLQSTRGAGDGSGRPERTRAVVQIEIDLRASVEICDPNQVGSTVAIEVSDDHSEAIGKGRVILRSRKCLGKYGKEQEESARDCAQEMASRQHEISSLGKSCGGGACCGE